MKKVENANAKNMIINEIQNIYNNYRVEKYPKYSSPISRFRKTWAPGIA